MSRYFFKWSTAASCFWHVIFIKFINFNFFSNLVPTTCNTSKNSRVGETCPVLHLPGKSMSSWMDKILTNALYNGCPDGNIDKYIFFLIISVFFQLPNATIFGLVTAISTNHVPWRSPWETTPRRILSASNGPTTPNCASPPWSAISTSAAARTWLSPLKQMSPRTWPRKRCRVRSHGSRLTKLTTRWLTGMTVCVRWNGWMSPRHPSPRTGKLTLPPYSLPPPKSCLTAVIGKYLYLVVIINAISETKPNLDMTLAVAEVLSPNKPNQTSIWPWLLLRCYSPINQTKPRYDPGCCWGVKPQ